MKEYFGVKPFIYIHIQWHAINVFLTSALFFFLSQKEVRNPRKWQNVFHFISAGILLTELLKKAEELGQMQTRFR